jgi:hypothetical protein
MEKGGETMANWEDLGISNTEDTRDIDKMTPAEMQVEPVITHHNTREWIVFNYDHSQIIAQRKDYATAVGIAESLL